MPLHTVDIPGVELARTGRHTGIGSAAGGDEWTVADLQAMAAGYQDGDPIPLEWVDDAKAPRLGIGHMDQDQVTGGDPDLLDESGAPALGWIRQLRVQGDRLVADLEQVPRKVADLMQAGAYRNRSIEFLRIPDPATGRERRVLTGLRLLGGRRPAVSGLADVMALYEADFAARAAEGMGAVVYAAPDDIGASVEAGDDQRPDATDPPRQMETTSMDELRKLLGLADTATDDEVRDAVAKLTQSTKDQGDELAALKARMDQIEAAASGDGDEDGDAEGEKPEAEKAEAVAAAYEARVGELEATLKTLEARAAAGEQAARVLYERERDDVIARAMDASAPKIDPASKDAWVAMYERDPKGTRELLDAMPVNPALAAPVGYEQTGSGDDMPGYDEFMGGFTNVPGRDAARKGA